MQENPQEIKKPSCYDWSEFIARMRAAGCGTLAEWCRNHDFAYKTVWALIYGTYVDGAGPKIKAIIAQALKEELIFEVDPEALHDLVKPE